MADGITRIAVEGFKSISKRQSIDIAPLTILAGANSSGKSSIMQPLLMLKQTLEAPHDSGPLLMFGGNVKFTSSDQFFSKNPGLQKLVKRLSIEIEIPHFEFHVTFSKGLKSSIEVLKATRILNGIRLTLRPNMPSDEIRELVVDAYPFGAAPDLAFSVVQNRFLLDARAEGGLTLEFTSGIEPWILSLIHVPGLRSRSSRTYPVASAGPNFPATFEYYVASVISRWQTEKCKEAEALNDDLKSLRLAERITARQLTEVEIDLQVNRLSGKETKDMISIADVGFGVAQVIPTLVALRIAEPGQAVYLEEPEIHLHPRAQVKLADILANAAKRGVRVVAETHSTLLLTAIQTLVAKGELKPELVKFHWFQRDPKTGVTKITSTDLDENGAFVDSDWPEDFDDVILKADGAYLDAVEGRQAR